MLKTILIILGIIIAVAVLLLFAFLFLVCYAVAKMADEIGEEF